METKGKAGRANEGFLNKLENTSGEVEKNLRRIETSLTLGTRNLNAKKLVGSSQELDLERLTNEYKTEKLHEVVRRVQESNFERINKLKIQVKNETKKELYEILLKIQQQYYEENTIMQQETETKTYRMLAKAKELEDFLYNLNQQNIIVRTFNLQDFEFEDKTGSDQVFSEIRDLKSSIEALTTSFNAIKVVNFEYKKDAEKANEAVKHSSIVIERMNNVHLLAVNKLQDRLGKKESEVLEEMSDIKVEYQSFRNKIEQELEIREVLRERQHEFIITLLDELKNMKIVLQNPTLRNKTYKKLKQTSSFTKTSQKLPGIGSTLTSVTKPSHDMLVSRSTNIKLRSRSSFKP